MQPRSRGADGSREATEPRPAGAPAGRDPAPASAREIRASDLFDRSRSGRDAALEQQLFGALTAACGPLTEASLPGHHIGLTGRSRRFAVSLVDSLGRVDRMPADRRAWLVSQLRDQWLPSGMSLEQIANRVEIAVASGYIAVDDAPTSDFKDGVGYRDGELRDLREILTHLPPSLCALEGVSFVTRDAKGRDIDALLDTFDKRFAGLPRSEQIKLLPARAFAQIARMLDLSLLIGQADKSTQEVRLYNEIFLGDKIPGFKRLLAYVTIHELGHHLYGQFGEVYKRWQSFYLAHGQKVLPYKQADDMNEAFAIGLGMYAVAPEKLKDVGGDTFAFFAAEFGDSLQYFRGPGAVQSVIDLVYRV